MVKLKCTLYVQAPHLHVQMYFTTEIEIGFLMQYDNKTHLTLYE